MKSKIIDHVRAGYHGRYLLSPEEQRVEAEMHQVAKGLNYSLQNDVGSNPEFRAGESLLVSDDPTKGFKMEIKRAGTQASGKGPADWFTGTVRIDPLFQAAAPARAMGAAVTFEPGARTAWHTHPLGQTLIVTAGSGLAQRWDGLIEQIRPGDIVWFPPGEKHWHGATPTTAMTHIAIQEALDAKAVDWMEKVTDKQYAPDKTATPPGEGS